MLRIILGRAGAGKTDSIMDEIKKRIELGRDGNILVVPDQYSHDAERMLCEKCGDKVSMYAQVLSFTRMCSRVFAEQGGIADTFLDDAGKILVMGRAIELSADQIKVYGGLSKRSEFIAKMVETAKEFRSAKISISDISDAALKASGVLKDKLGDLAIIMQIYYSLLKHEVRDPDEKLDRLAEMLPNGRFAKKGSIWFDGFCDFTVQQLCVIEELLKIAENITFAITCDDIYSDDELFEGARNTVKGLIALAEKLKIKYEVEKTDKSMVNRPAELKFLEKNLFSNSNRVFDGVNSSVSAYICKNPVEECEVAAAKSIELVQNGARWREIAVAIGAFDAYSGVIDSIFGKYKVPFYMNTKLDIMQMPPVITLTSALKIISGGWSYEDVFTYLKTGFAGISREECDELENYVLMWNIRGSMWYRDEAWQLSQDGYRAAADENTLEALNIIRKKVVAPLKQLQIRIKAAETNAEKLNAVVAFTEDIGLYEQIEAHADLLISRGERQTAEWYLNLGEVITSALEQLYNVAGEYTATTEEFLYQLELLMKQYDVGVIPTGIDCVTVGDITRLKKRCIKHLIVLGMTDADVPKLSHASGIFSEAERDELISMNVSLAQTSVQRLYGDITAVYDTVTMPEETLTVMYPRTDSVGNANEPSFVFNGILSGIGINPKIPKSADYKMFAKNTCMEFAAISQKTDSAAVSASEYFAEDKDFKELMSTVREISGLYKKHISPERAKMLYGDRVTMTASRVDKYNSCRYAYFLQYGLKAKPRIKAEFDASVIGTFMHYILEKVTGEVEKAGGFKAVDDNACIVLTKKYINEFVKNELQNMQDKSKRFKYLFNALTDDTVSIVLNMAAELRNSDFRPVDFELGFSSNGKLPPYEVYGNDTSLAVRGIVDRVDGWIHDDRLYIRVVDYKTGYKSFNLSDVWYGMGMQMLIYLFALQAMGKSRYNMEIVPAGILYAPAREILLSETRHVSNEEIEKNRLKSLRRSGMILNDDEVIEAMEHGKEKNYLPVRVGKDGSFSGESLASAEQLGQLAKHIDKVLLDISREIFSGDVSADPYYRNQSDNSCMYCDYFHACHYSEERDGKYRELTKLKTPEVWEKLQEEAGNE